MSFRAEGSGGMGRTVHEESDEEPRNLPPPWYSVLMAQSLNRVQISIKKKGCAKMIDIFAQPFDYRHLLLKQRLFLYIL